MLACGWLGESAVVVIMRLMLASLSLVIASYALVSHTCSEPHFESHLSQYVDFTIFLIVERLIIGKLKIQAS